MVCQRQEKSARQLPGDLWRPSPWLDDVQVSEGGLLLSPGLGENWLTDSHPFRADFNDLHVFEEYLRGYRIIRTFFAAHM